MPKPNNKTPENPKTTPTSKAIKAVNICRDTLAELCFIELLSDLFSKIIIGIVKVNNKDNITDKEKLTVPSPNFRRRNSMSNFTAISPITKPKILAVKEEL